MAFQNSYEYQNLKRDLSDIFNQVLIQSPNILSLIPVGAAATATKHEWLEDKLSPQTFSVDGNYTAGGGTVTLDSTAGLEVGDILTYRTVNNASIETKHIITTVVDSPDINIAPYGSAVDVNIPDNAVVRYMRPIREGSDPVIKAGQEPVVKYNFTQIFQEAVMVTKTAEKVGIYGLDSKINYQVGVAMDRLKRDLNTAVLYGERVQRTGTTPGTRGTMGGLMYYLNQSTSGNVINGGAALDYSMLNSAMITGYSLGATNLSAIVCSPRTANKISSFNQSIVQTQRTDSTTGSAITSVVSGLGNVSKVIHDHLFPDDQLLIVDTSKISLHYLQPLELADATPTQASNYISKSLLTELTMEVRNAETGHILLKNFTL
jgi:hypothetical protein